MEIVIGIILLIIVLFVVGFFIKKRYYSEIDRLETWKIEIMNRPVLDEVGKIKQLKMSGQAEEFFERWRKSWDAIVTVELPDVEEWLYDAEEYVDKFRFRKAKDVFMKIEDALNQAESKIEHIVKDLNDIIGSEQKNREEIIEIQEFHKKLKKDLLAHRHAYAKSATTLEKMLNLLDEKFSKFDEETDKGNYLIAREIVLNLKDELQSIHEKMETIPLLLNDCQHIIPNQIKEIENGVKEMTKDGYYLDHINIQEELSRMKKQVEMYNQLIEKAEISEVTTGVEEIKDNLNMLYDLLEEEVASRKFVNDHYKNVKQSLDELIGIGEQLKEEVEIVKMSYHLSDEDESILHETNDKLEMMKKTVNVLLMDNEIHSSAYSAIKEKLEEYIQEIEEIQEKQQSFSDLLKALRKDELEARDKIQGLKKQIQETTRLVERSNVPGIPADIENYFLYASEAIHDCFRNLEQKPLSIPAVTEALKKAEESVSNVHQQVVEMIENVYLIERIIQYGNRYRNDHADLNKKLIEAEKAFRQYDYSRALEEAATAVESVEPGALKRIETLLDEETKNDY